MATSTSISTSSTRTYDEILATTTPPIPTDDVDR